MKKVELLAPAGEMESFKAAVNAGADAVYLGGDKFNARAYASNFNGEALLEVLDTAHLFGRKIYLTLNTLFKDEELPEIYDYIYPLYENGLDGVIVQDIGAAKLLHECFPELPLHASTQMSITGADGIRFLQGLSFKRVVPARELSLKELEKMHRETGMELECFVHGALCYSYSGKCLFSSLLGGRSGNRGRCAGPCRLPYNGKFPLSAKDICAIDIMDKLIEAGIYSFKIEGRMKSAEYVAAVTGIYRKYIDIALSGELSESSGHSRSAHSNTVHKKKGGYRVSKNDRENLIGLYTRSGNSQGYYYVKNGPEMISIDSPSYESADEQKKKSLYIKYAGTASRIEVDAYALIRENSETELVLSVAEADGDNEDSQARFGLNGEIAPKQGDSIQSLNWSMSVTVYGDKAEKAKNRSVSEEFVARQLEKCGSTGFNIRGMEIAIKGSPFLSAASLNDLRRKGLEALRREILNKYRRGAEADPAKAEDCINSYASEVYITSENNKNSHEILQNNIDVVNITSTPSSVSALLETSIPSSASTLLETSTSLSASAYTSTSLGTGDKASPELHVRLNGLEALDAVLDEPGVSVVTVPLLSFSDEAELEGTYERIKKKGISFCPAFPYILREESIKALPVSFDRISQYSDSVLIDNYEVLFSLLDTGYDKMIIEDIHLYDMNRISREVLKCGSGKIVTCVPVELNKKELFRRGIKGEELIVYGRLPMMLSAQCVKKTLSGCEAPGAGSSGGYIDGKTNGKPVKRSLKEGVSDGASDFCGTGDPIYLKDRLGNDFPCVNFCRECTNVIYNSVPLFITKEDGVIERLKPRYLRLDFTTESAGEITDIISYYRSMMDYLLNSCSDKKSNCLESTPDGVYDKNNYVNQNHSISHRQEPSLPPVEKYTKGHLNRGVQ